MKQHHHLWLTLFLVLVCPRHLMLLQEIKQAFIFCLIKTKQKYMLAKQEMALADYKLIINKKNLIGLSL